MSNRKKQIVFIEPKPTVYNYRIARSLKEEGYPTTLISFSELNKDFFKEAYDEIKVLELSHKMRFKDFIDLLKKMLGGRIKTFFEDIKKMKPYLFQITGPDLFSLMAIHLLRKNYPKIYYSNDIWSTDKRNFFFTKMFWAKGEFQKIFEKISFRKVDGILNKKSIGEFELMNYKVRTQKMALPPACLDAWTFPPKKKKEKEIHICYAGSPNPVGGEIISFINIIKIITTQKIHFHTYGPCLNEKDNRVFIQEAKRNKFYHKHDKLTPYELNKEMSNYDYGILPEFIEQKIVESNPTLTKTQLCSRMINYFEAGIPVLVNQQHEYMARIVKKYGLGFEIIPKDLKELKTILKQKNYSLFQKNIKKFQGEFKWSRKIVGVEKFYEKIINQNVKDGHR